MSWYPGKIIGDVFRGGGNPGIPKYKLERLEKTKYKFLFDIAHGVLDGIAYPDDKGVVEYYLRSFRAMVWWYFPEISGSLERYFEETRNPRTALETAAQDIYSEIAYSADTHGFEKMWATIMFLKFLIGRIYLLFPEDMYKDVLKRLCNTYVISTHEYQHLERLGKETMFFLESAAGLRREVFEKEGPEAGIKHHLGSSDYHTYLNMLRAILNRFSYSIGFHLG